MNIQLTPQQQEVLDTQGEPLPRVIDPRTNVAYVLVPESAYDVVREVLEDERRQRTIRAVALGNAAGRLSKEVKTTDIPPDVTADLEAAARYAVTGEFDAETLRRIEQRAAQARQELLQKMGVQEISAQIIREMRDSR